MLKNRTLWVLLLLLIILSIFTGTLLYKNKLMKVQLYAAEKSTSFLILNRNLEIYKTLKENNLTRLKNNLDMYLNIGLSPIEIHGIEKHLNIKRSQESLCNKYKDIWSDFLEYNTLKYPSATNDLRILCDDKF